MVNLLTCRTNHAKILQFGALLEPIRYILKLKGNLTKTERFLNPSDVWCCQFKSTTRPKMRYLVSRRGQTKGLARYPTPSVIPTSVWYFNRLKNTAAQRWVHYCDLGGVRTKDNRCAWRLRQNNETVKHYQHTQTSDWEWSLSDKWVYQSTQSAERSELWDSRNTRAQKIGRFHKWRSARNTITIGV